MILERLDDLFVAELEHAITPLDDRDFAAEGREDRRVLDADDPGTDDDERRGDAVESQDPVGVDDALAVERDVRRACGARPRGDHDVTRGDPQLAAAVIDRERVLVDEARRAVEQLDAIPGELVLHDLVLAGHDLRGSPGEVVHRDVALDAVALPVDFALRQPRQIEDRLAQRLRRNGARVDAYAPDHGGPLHDGGPLPELRGCDGGLLTAWAASDDEQIVVEHARHLGRHLATAALPLRSRCVTRQKHSRAGLDRGARPQLPRSSLLDQSPRGPGAHHATSENVCASLAADESWMRRTMSRMRGYT